MNKHGENIMSFGFDKEEYLNGLLTEWSYRVDDGKPDPQNFGHQMVLRDILTEWDWDMPTINEFITNLKEVESTKRGTLIKGKPTDAGTTRYYFTDEKEDLHLVTKGYGQGKQWQPASSNDVAKKDVSDESGESESGESKLKRDKIEAGKLGDAQDKLSDGGIKQRGLEIGYTEKDGFKPAPGNAGSMLAEIMTGEVSAHLENNSNMTDNELADAIYSQVMNTALGRQNAGIGTSDKKSKIKVMSRGMFEGKNKELAVKCQIIAKAGREKYERMSSAIKNLQENGKLGNQVDVRNYYGHEISIKKQVNLIENNAGPFYTSKGVEIPKDVLVDLIRKSGGGENPSDTSTIALDSEGRGVVTFHSDKLTTADIQANSTPNMESEQAKKMVDKMDISDSEKEKSKSIIENGQKHLTIKEDQLKQAANGPARELAGGDVEQILSDIKSDKGITGKATASSHLAKSLMSRGKIHPYIRKYLPQQDTGYSEAQLLKAFYEFAGDDNAEHDLTTSQLKLLYRSAKQNGYDISSKLGKIREESLQVQRDTNNELNKMSITLPSGDKKPLGDYIESQNIMDKLHIGVVDGEKGHGVGKYPGLFNLNMGGTIVEAEQIRHCLNVENSNDFVQHFKVGIPGAGEEVIRNAKTGQITGNNVFIYAIDKSGKKIPIAVKTQRSKHGESGKLNTTYQWSPQTQKCFKLQSKWNRKYKKYMKL